MRTVILLGLSLIADAISKSHGSAVQYSSAAVVLFSTTFLVAIAMDILDFIRDL